MSEDEANPLSAPLAPPKFDGDDGTTTLGLVGKVNNDDIRLAAYQDCGEVNSAIGMVLAMAGGLGSQDIAMLSSIQNDLFDLTSDIGSGMAGEDASIPHVTSAHVERLERACAFYATGRDKQQDAAVLPGGTVAAALLYQARSISERAERSTWTASVEYPEMLSPLPHRYLNRLSELLAILGHNANAEHGDTRWVPMASTAPVPSSNGTGGNGTRSSDTADR